MKPPSVEKACSARILPSLAALGFKRAGGKRFARISADVIQLVFLHVRSGMHREYMLQYCSLLAFEPQLHAALSHGGDFPIGSRSPAWQRADSDEKLDRSMSKTEKDLPELLSWFEASASLAGFVATYEERVSQEAPVYRNNGHSSFTLACGRAASGDLSESADHLRRAVAEYQAILQSYTADYPQNAHAHWAHERLQRCKEFATALEQQSTAALFGLWRETSLANLKLDP